MNVTTGEVDDNGGGSSTTGRGGGLVSSGCRRARAPLPGPGPPGPRQALIDGSVSVRLSGTSRHSLRLTHWQCQVCGDDRQRISVSFVFRFKAHLVKKLRYYTIFISKLNVKLLRILVSAVKLYKGMKTYHPLPLIFIKVYIRKLQEVKSPPIHF